MRLDQPGQVVKPLLTISQVGFHGHEFGSRAASRPRPFGFGCPVHAPYLAYRLWPVTVGQLAFSGAVILAGVSTLDHALDVRLLAQRGAHEPVALRGDEVATIAYEQGFPHLFHGDSQCLDLDWII